MDGDCASKYVLLKKIEQLDDMHGPLLKRAMADSRSTNTKVIRFMQFNILAEGLSAPPKYGGFVFSPKECLEWGFRKFRVVEEIIKYDPDVLCLEEVDHFDDFLLPALKNFGYEGIFQPKTDSPTLQFGDDKFSDGCAIFWKKEILKIVDQKSVIYKNPDLEGSAWSQVALIARMTRANDEGSPFIVSSAPTVLAARAVRVEAGLCTEEVFGERDATLRFINDFPRSQPWLARKCLDQWYKCVVDK